MLKGWHFGVPEGDVVNGFSLDIPVTNATETKIHAIDEGAGKRGHREFILQHNKDSQNLLKKSERSIKVGFTCLILRYFSALSVVQKEKEIWANDNDGITSNKKKILTKERLKMIEEEKNISFRKRAAEYANEKARRGEERIRLRHEATTAEKVIFVLFYSFLNMKK
jgi:hypothetical protein